ncbi:glutathione S-transferase family protein [Kushneria sp. Sum13]|uniref:glutathione S-transferase family protein n=1 Tax=Kushneria sp. Sum13 TaxID=3459196 RepID=UPI004045595F
MSTTLYAHRLSQPSRAVEVLARELGIEYTFHEVDFADGETRTEAYAAINAFQTVPALVVDRQQETLHLAESQAIMLYLCRTATYQDAARRWYPGEQDLPRSARIDQWLAWYHANVRRFRHVSPHHEPAPDPANAQARDSGHAIKATAGRAQTGTGHAGATLQAPAQRRATADAVGR